MNTGDVGKKLERVMQSVKTKEQTIVALKMLNNACKQKPKDKWVFYKWFEIGMLSNKTILFKPMPLPTNECNFINGFPTLKSQMVKPDVLLKYIWPE